MIYLIWASILDCVGKHLHNSINTTPAKQSLNWNYILFNLCIIHPIASVVIYFNLSDLHHNNITTNVQVIQQVLLLGMLYDFIFYCLHRACHQFTFLYRYIHRFHHRHLNTRALNTLDTHPLEHLCVNLAPVLIVTQLFNISIAAFVIFGLMGAMFSVHSHSGQQYVSVGAHDQHHLIKHCEFGVFITDYIFHTTTNDYNCQ